MKFLGENMKQKYKNKKTKINGITFDSKKEAKRYQELKWLEKEGSISDLELQPKFKFVINGLPLKANRKGARQVTYSADFRYLNKQGEMVVEDVKGFITDVYKIKEALMNTVFGIKIERV